MMICLSKSELLFFLTFYKIKKVNRNDCLVVFLIQLEPTTRMRGSRLAKLTFFDRLRVLKLDHFSEQFFLKKGENCDF